MTLSQCEAMLKIFVFKDYSELKLGFLCANFYGVMHEHNNFLGRNICYSAMYH